MHFMPGSRTPHPPPPPGFAFLPPGLPVERAAPSGSPPCGAPISPTCPSPASPQAPIRSWASQHLAGAQTPLPPAPRGALVVNRGMGEQGGGGGRGPPAAAQPPLLAPSSPPPDRCACHHRGTHACMPSRRHAGAQATHPKGKVGGRGGSPGLGNGAADAAGPQRLLFRALYPGCVTAGGITQSVGLSRAEREPWWESPRAGAGWHVCAATKQAREGVGETSHGAEGGARASLPPTLSVTQLIP